MKALQAACVSLYALASHIKKKQQFLINSNNNSNSNSNNNNNNILLILKVPFRISCYSPKWLQRTCKYTNRKEDRGKKNATYVSLNSKHGSRPMPIYARRVDLILKAN